jgi:hypothetical protein
VPKRMGPFTQTMNECQARYLALPYAVWKLAPSPADFKLRRSIDLSELYSVRPQHRAERVVQFATQST